MLGGSERTVGRTTGNRHRREPESNSGRWAIGLAA